MDKMDNIEKPTKRALFVAYYFPPLSGSGVFRSLKFAKYLREFGYEPTVISTDAPPLGWNFSDDTQVKEIPNNMEVVRVPDTVGHNPDAKLDGKEAEDTLNFLLLALNRSEEAKSIFDAAFADKNNVPQLLQFPCPALVWAKDAARAIEKREDLESFDIVYTTSGPASAHLVGFYLKEKYNIPWVADYRDEWTFNPAGKYDPNIPAAKMLFCLENVLLRFADCNLTVSEMAVPNYEEHFDLKNGENIICITNGYDEEDFANFPKRRKKNKRFTLNYSGLIYAGRSIESIMKAVKELVDEKKISEKEICFSFMGTSTENVYKIAGDFDLESTIQAKDYGSHEEAIAANINADINILLLGGEDETHKRVYTGKVFEQLRSGRPILCIGAKGGVVDTALTESGHGKVFLSAETEGIKNFIYEEYKLYKAAKNLSRKFSPAIKKFERKYLTGELAKVFDKVIGEK